MTIGVFLQRAVFRELARSRVPRLSLRHGAESCTRLLPRLIQPSDYLGSIFELEVCLVKDRIFFRAIQVAIRRLHRRLGLLDG